MPTRRVRRATPAGRGGRIAVGHLSFRHRAISGAQQAAFFLAVSRPGPRTLLALDLEANEDNPSNSMRLEQAEAFVQAVAERDGPVAARLCASDLGQWRSLPSGLTSRPHHAGVDPCALRPLGRRLPRLAGDPAGLGSEGLAALAVCQRRVCGPARLRPQQNHPRCGPLRSQLVQRRRGCALPVLERGRLSFVTRCFIARWPVDAWRDRERERHRRSLYGPGLRPNCGCR